MFKALQMLVSPMQAWEAVVAANRRFAWGFFAVLIPFLLLGVAIENAGLRQWGEKRGEYGGVARVSPELVARHALVQIATGLLAAFIAAKLVEHVGSGMNVQCGFGRVFAVVACGLVPILLMRIPDAHPAIPTWLCFGVGAALAFGVLYHGVALGLQPEQTKGFGLFMLTWLIVVALAAVAHLISVVTLQERLFQDLRIPGLI